MQRHMRWVEGMRHACNVGIVELIDGLIEGIAYPERDAVSKWVDKRIDLTEACLHFTRCMEGCL